MPSSSQHQAQIDHNNNFLSLFSEKTTKSTYADWSIIVIFFSAMHVIEKYFSEVHKKHNINHNDRNQAIKNDIRLTKIYPDYRRLYDWSRELRYDVTFINFDDKDVEEAKKHYKNIENTVRRIIPH
jgi:hypothetical protein